MMSAVVLHQVILVNRDNKEDNQTLTAVMNLVPWGWRSSSFWNIEEDTMEEGGVEEHKNEGGSLLL